MADPVDIDKALVALKKGTQLMKYGRKGKPKFYPFRLSNDESALIWTSSSKEKSLQLASVSRILSGQRTLVFQRYLLPQKDQLSFSLIYKNGRRSLDLVCKDKVEADVWFTTLKSLISSCQDGPSKIDGFRDGGSSYDSGRDSSLSGSPIATVDSAKLFQCGRDSSTSSNSFITVDSLDNKLSISSPAKNQLFEGFTHSERTDVIDMQAKGSSDVRISVSSAPSTSSHGSGTEDAESFGDVYVWGEIIHENSSMTDADKNINSASSRADILLPKPLEFNVMLDVNYVACGVRHAALVTRLGEVFTWGEECSGRLGHGVKTDMIHPHLVESLSACNVETVSCGEFHSCAVTVAGELYTWGDGTHNAGLLGHGTKVGHWTPKRVLGPLEGLQVSTVSCGTWHTALIAITGQLYTFGDGTFGVLGHGNRESVLCPKEVEAVKGLRTLAVSCGVWHTAAVVEVIVTQSSTSSGKLFTWGDADKYRLGHGDKAPRLKPTCVSSLIEYNFHKVACGHSLTTGLTTSGHLFAMGSSVYGQLGNPQSDGKAPCLVEENLLGEAVVQVACGAYHVAVLTIAGEVYTWGKGANGRLGHGDTGDRKMPTVVEALKDRVVKQIVCGATFTAAICHHKWVSGAEQSQCSACRQTFGLTRKRHNCYNCGLVHCHSCSSKKALRAALSPNPGKPYRVCDSCYLKLSKVIDSGANNCKKNAIPRASIVYSIKGSDVKAAKQAKKSDSVPQFSSILQLKDIPFIGGVNMQQAVSTLLNASLVSSTYDPSAISPISRKLSPATSTVATQTIESQKEANEILNQEVQRLRAEVEGLRQRCELQGVELQKSALTTQEAMTIAADEISKSKAAKEVIKSLTAQLKEMAERLPPGAYETKPMQSTDTPNGIIPPDVGRDNQLRYYDPNNVPYPPPTSIPSARPNGANATTTNFPSSRFENQNYVEELSNSSRTEDFTQPEAGGFQPERLQINPNGSNAKGPTPAGNQTDTEWIETYEPGVYLTLVALRDGTRELKRVRFSRRRFRENQAESWWSENRDKVYEKYNIRGSDMLSTTMPT